MSVAQADDECREIIAQLIGTGSEEGVADDGDEDALTAVACDTPFTETFGALQA